MNWISLDITCDVGISFVLISMQISVNSTELTVRSCLARRLANDVGRFQKAIVFETMLDIILWRQLLSGAHNTTVVTALKQLKPIQRFCNDMHCAIFVTYIQSAERTHWVSFLQLTYIWVTQYVFLRWSTATNVHTLYVSYSCIFAGHTWYRCTLVASHHYIHDILLIHTHIVKKPQLTTALTRRQCKLK